MRYRLPLWLGLLSIFLLLAVLTGLNWRKNSANVDLELISAPTETFTPLISNPEVFLPELVTSSSILGIPRLALVHTHIPERPTYEVTTYTVQQGDTAWSIAEKYGLKPETILWGNQWISAEAASLQIGTELNILPVDGVLHIASEGDTLERVQLLYGTPIDEILDFPGNDFGGERPERLTPGQKIIVPYGRSQVVWIEPGPRVVAGLGRRSPGLYDGPLVYTGSGYFSWPIAPPYRITQNFWEAHPAIDLGTYFRQPIFASDHGTVIFSGFSQSGYGNLVIVDHANGYWTYYAHNEANLVSVGQGVLKGQQIAESGSTGISTGNHIDFRIRVDGGSFLNPLNFLP
jgi:murein DD-endopeptidase MepM/ murein hydrolase activator NlpD